MIQKAPTRRVSRQLVMAACAWLLLSWALNLWIDPPLVPRHLPDAAYEFSQRITPAIRGMLISIVAGLALMWPALRLSQYRGDGTQLGCDLVTLGLLVQIVLWPMRVLVGWSLARTLTIDLVVLESGAAAALMAWAGLRGGWGARALAMLGCGALLGGPFLAGALLGAPGAAAWSPVRILWMLTDERGPLSVPAAAGKLMTGGLVIAAGWLALARSGETPDAAADNMDPLKPDRASPGRPGRDGEL